MSNVEDGFSAAFHTEYNLGPILSERKLTGGIANDLYLIETSDQKYVYKKYRNPTSRIQDEQQFLLYLETNSFPVPHIIPKNRNCELFESSNDLLYEFVDGYCPQEPNALTDNQLKQAGHTLGIYHSLVNDLPTQLMGQEPNSPRINPKHFFSQNVAITLWNNVGARIKNKQQLDNIDERIVEISGPMLTALKNINADFLNELIRTNPRIFCHGDYQGTNLVFGPNDDIKVVIDWESRSVLPRSWEILYAIAVMCKVRNTENFNTPLDLRKAKIFMSAYREEQELTDVEIEAMPLMAYAMSLSTPYLLQTHYLEANPKLDRFFPLHLDDWLWWQVNYQRFSEAIK